MRNFENCLDNLETIYDYGYEDGFKNIDDADNVARGIEDFYNKKQMIEVLENYYYGLLVGKMMIKENNNVNCNCSERYDLDSLKDKAHAKAVLYMRDNY